MKSNKSDLWLAHKYLGKALRILKRYEKKNQHPHSKELALIRYLYYRLGVFRQTVLKFLLHAKMRKK